MNQQSGRESPYTVWAWHCVEVLFSLLTSSIVYFMAERLGIYWSCLPRPLYIPCSSTIFSINWKKSCMK